MLNSVPRVHISVSVDVPLVWGTAGAAIRLYVGVAFQVIFEASTNAIVTLLRNDQAAPFAYHKFSVECLWH